MVEGGERDISNKPDEINIIKLRRSSSLLILILSLEGIKCKVLEAIKK